MLTITYAPTPSKPFVQSSSQPSAELRWFGNAAIAFATLAVSALAPATVSAQQAESTHQRGHHVAVIDVTYIFTVFQHIPREYSLSLLSQVANVLNENGVVVFNLLSNVNMQTNDGEIATEWAIGYSREQARDLVSSAGLKLLRLVRWSRPETEISWLWVLAGS